MTIIDDIRTVKKILDGAKIIFWLDAGTLLGAVRDGKMIPWDNDCDLSVMETYSKDLENNINNFRKAGFKVAPAYYEDHVIRKLKLQRAKDYSVDIIVLRKKGKMAYSYCKFTERKERRYRILRTSARLANKALSKVWSTYNKSKIGRAVTKKYFEVYTGKTNKNVKKVPSMVPLEFYSNLDRIKFYGLSFNIPNNSHKYLEKRYGKNWKIPKKDWTYWKDDGFIRK